MKSSAEFLADTLLTIG